MGTTQGSSILFFDGPVYIDDETLLVDDSGDITAVADVQELVDFVEETIQDGGTAFSDPSHDYLTVKGSLRRIPRHPATTVICNTLTGKDVWMAFADYDDLIAAIVDGIGSKVGKFRAIKKAREYWSPPAGESMSWHETDKSARKQIRKQ
jgi:hypothetical protein